MDGSIVLASAERKVLLDWYRTDADPSVRLRAHILLLLAAGQSWSMIAIFLFCSIRVFVSSTFNDMKHERNALEAEAFPQLEQLCQRHEFQFQAIDLRWGVSTDAGLDHRTMRICFDELRRAQEISPRPDFLVLLGNRYGWRPLPEEISPEEFHALEHAAAQIPSGADKAAVAVLREWYREDTNAVPPVYLLQSRRQDLGDDQDYTHDAVWNRVQTALWAIINRAAPPEQLQRRFDAAASDGSPPAIVRFQASATEQEIWQGALRVPDAREHVLAFFREIENLAAFSDPKQIKDFVDVDPSGRVEVALQTEQDRLKAELRQRLGEANVFRNEVPEGHRPTVDSWPLRLYFSGKYGWHMSMMPLYCSRMVHG